MMKTFGMVATAAIATQANAFEWEDVKTYAAPMLGHLVNGVFDIDVYDQPVWEHIELTNRHHVRAKLRENKRRVKQLTPAQRKRTVDAHHSLMAQRERLGLPLVGAGPNVEQSYSELNSTSGFILNMLTGMAYNGDATNSSCYSASESLIIALDTSSDIFKKIYIAAYWAEAQVQIQDSVAILAGVYVDCSIDKIFTTLLHLASSEGIAEVTGRVTGALPFQIRKCQSVYNNPEDYSTKERGNAYGQCVSIVLNYTI